MVQTTLASADGNRNGPRSVSPCQITSTPQEHPCPRPASPSSSAASAPTPSTASSPRCCATRRPTGVDPRHRRRPRRAAVLQRGHRRRRTSPPPPPRCASAVAARRPRPRRHPGVQRHHARRAQQRHRLAVPPVRRRRASPASRSASSAPPPRRTAASGRTPTPAARPRIAGAVVVEDVTVSQSAHRGRRAHRPRGARPSCAAAVARLRRVRRRRPSPPEPALDARTPLGSRRGRAARPDRPRAGRARPARRGRRRSSSSSTTSNAPTRRRRRRRRSARSSRSPPTWPAPRAGQLEPLERGASSPLYGVPTAIKDLNLTAGVPHDVRLAGLRRLRAGRLRRRHPGDRGRRAWSASARPARRSSARPATPSPRARRRRSRPWDRDPDGRRLLRRRGRRGGGRAGPGGPGLRRRRLDPDPGLVLRAGRAQADPRADQRSPHVRRPGGSGDGRLDRPDRRATRPRCSTCSPVVGRGIRPGRHLRPGRSSRPATAIPAGFGSLGSSRQSSPTSLSTPSAVGPGRTPRGCSSRSATRSWTSPVPLPPEAVPVFETCWAVLTALSVVPPEQEPLLRPLTRWLTERGRAVSGPEFGLAHRRDAPVRGRRADRAGAVRRRADADARDAAAAGRRDPRRRRPGGRLRGAEGVHARGPRPGTSPACRPSRCRCTGPPTACRSA